AAEDARGSAGRRDACGVEEVLHRQGNPVQRAKGTALRERLLGPPCRRNGMVGGHVEVAVNSWIDALDALEIGVHRLERRHLPGADAARQGDRGLVAEVVSIHGSSFGLMRSMSGFRCWKAGLGSPSPSVVHYMNPLTNSRRIRLAPCATSSWGSIERLPT